MPSYALYPHAALLRLRLDPSEVEPVLMGESVAAGCVSRPAQRDDRLGNLATVLEELARKIGK